MRLVASVVVRAASPAHVLVLVCTCLGVEGPSRAPWGKRKGVPNTEVACACLASPRGNFPCRTRQVLKAFELTIVAQEGSARAQNGIAEKSTRVDRDLLTPLKVLATLHLMLVLDLSFSERTFAYAGLTFVRAPDLTAEALQVFVTAFAEKATSPKQRKLDKQVHLFSLALSLSLSLSPSL